MTSLKKANRRVGSLFAVAALVLATVTPGLVPAFASAAQITERSVTLSSSSKAATGVSYDVAFTTSQTAAAIVVEFCSDTPLIGDACTAPAGQVISGLTTGNVTVGATGATAATTVDVTVDTNKAVAIEGGVVSGVNHVILGSITNPSAAGTIYARILTFDTYANAQAYTATVPGSGVKDQGSAALSITDTVGVNAAVLESMTFCVSGSEIDPDCDAGSITAPAVELGEGSAGVKSLVSTATSTGTIYTQLSTNATSGAVVSLRSNAVGCGGLLLAGHEGDCNIGPADGTKDAAALVGNPLFGITVADAADLSDGNGALTIVTGSGYTSSDFLLNYNATDESTGVTSPYGDPVLDTANAPANNKNASITFGASIANNTPAGRYSADFSLIATGKF